MVRQGAAIFTLRWLNFPFVLCASTSSFLSSVPSRLNFRALFLSDGSGRAEFEWGFENSSSTVNIHLRIASAVFRL
jgi:hypothetical protein